MKTEISPLLKRLKKNTKLEDTTLLSESTFFNQNDMFPTTIPTMNIALSGSLQGGLTNGLTMLSGESKSFKSLMTLILAKAYMDKYPDAVCIFVDSEFGIPLNYFSMLNISTDRVLHVPVKNIEDLNFELVNQLENGITKDDKVVIIVDSIGNLASKREMENALKENSAEDMTRAKKLKSFFRIVTPYLTLKNIPMIVVNHVYKSQGLYPVDIVSGGTGIYLSSSTIWIISRSKEKDGTDLSGYKFTIKVEKSRYVKEGSKFPIVVTFEDGIEKYSGLLDIALLSGIVVSESKGYYQKTDPNTGEILLEKYRRKATMNDDFWEDILKNPKFSEWIEREYQIGSHGKKLFKDREEDKAITFMKADSNAFAKKITRVLDTLENPVDNEGDE